MIRLQTPLTLPDRQRLSVGDRCLLSGQLYTARDAAHAKLVAALHRGERLPLDLDGQLIFYVGPCQPRQGEVIGAAGPTTSGRMDKYTPTLLEYGLAGSIGKGRRSEEVKAAMAAHGAVYFAATGGAGALLAQTVKSCQLLLYPELGPEAVYRLQVVDFPVVVAIDSQGNDLYQMGPSDWAI